MRGKGRRRVGADDSEAGLLLVRRKGANGEAEFSDKGFLLRKEEFAPS